MSSISLPAPVSPKIFGPMSLWASSFSSKTISDKTTAMNAAIDELREAVAAMEIAANGKEKDDGLFGFLGGSKELDPAKRSALAKKAYAKGVVAWNKCVRASNAHPSASERSARVPVSHCHHVYTTCHACRYIEIGNDGLGNSFAPLDTID